MMEEIHMGHRHHDKKSLLWGKQEKGGFLTPSSDDAFTPSWGDLILLPLQTFRHP